jgi:hypothetical protein
MAKIIINGTKEILGKLSIARAADFSKNPVEVSVGGQLSTHRYFEEIDSIETDRYKVTGVMVFQENYGSEDFDVVYSFTAEKFVVKGGESNLSEDDITVFEDGIYDPVTGGVRDER